MGNSIPHTGQPAVPRSPRVNLQPSPSLSHTQSPANSPPGSVTKSPYSRKRLSESALNVSDDALKRNQKLNSFLETTKSESRVAALVSGETEASCGVAGGPTSRTEIKIQRAGKRVRQSELQVPSTTREYWCERRVISQRRRDGILVLDAWIG